MNLAFPSLAPPYTNPTYDDVRMSDIQQYLLDYDRNKREATNFAQQTATRLQNGGLKLLALIEELGEYFNSEDGAIRSKTMSYLAEVLGFVPQKTLSLQQRNLLCDFVLSRLEDSEGLGSCGKALLALEERGKWDNERVKKIMETLLQQTHPLRQYRQQSERYPILRLIDTLMAKYRDVLQQLHDTKSDFMSRFISYFDGEKDPRNLMVVFSILRVPMTEWNIGADAQELFDAVFNYFPITFRPPPDDPYGITAQDLKDRLRECISSTSDFAPYAFPALLDKLDSTSMNTKRDVLQAITSAVTEYGPRTVSLYSITLWDSLKFEILNVQEEDLAREALTSLSAIARSLSRSTDELSKPHAQETTNGPLNAYLRPISKECNEHLEDAPTKQSQASGSILHAISKASPESTNLISSLVLPELFTLFQTADTIAKRRGLLEVLVQLIRANTEVYGDWRSIGTAGEPAPPNGLSEFKEQALDTMLTGLATAPIKEVSFRLVCLDGLLQLSKVRQLLTDKEVGKFIEQLHAIVIHEESYGKDEIKEAAMNGLVELAHQKPQVVVEKAFPAFLAQLPDTDVGQPTGYVPVLEAFAKLGSEEKIYDTVILRLKNKLTSAVQQQASSSYISALLSAMLYALNQGAGKLEQGSESAPYYQDIVFPLLSRAANPDSAHPKAFEEEATLDLVGRICNIIVRSLPLHQQNGIARELYTLFTEKPQRELPPFNAAASLEQHKTMIVSTHLFASFQKDATLPCEVQELILTLVNYSQQTSLSPTVRSASLRQISLLLNKYVPASLLRTCLDPLLSPSIDLFNPEKLDPLRVRIIFAIFKGILLRNSPSLSQLYPQLLSFLSHPDYGILVAHGFTTLLQPDDLLTKQNHCQISGLHKQKSFALLVPNITKLFREAQQQKKNYLIALSGVLKWMPFDIVVEEVEQLTPLLLQSLDLEGEDLVKESAIATLSSILSHKPKEIESHASSLISRLCDNTTKHLKRKPSATPILDGKDYMVVPPRVRVQALKCLAQVPKALRTEVCLRYKRQVVKKLTGALDDGRREVRGEAVRCRSAWLEVDEVVDDD